MLFAPVSSALLPSLGRGFAQHTLAAVALLLLVALPGIATATLFEIQDGSEIFGPVSDFTAVAGNDTSSAPGQVIDVLMLQSNGSESGSNSLSMGDLRSTLEAGGVTNTTLLVLGFGLNETGQPGSNSVIVTDLVVSFERAGGGTDTFSLSPDQVRVFNYAQGQNTAEAKFEIDLGFDFMSEYTNASSELFSINASIDNTSDGFEIFFLSSGFTLAPPSATLAMLPEPGTLSLLAMSLVFLAVRRRRMP